MASLMNCFGILVTIFAIPVSGLSFTFTRDSILIGDTGTQTLSCRVDETDVQGIYSIRMFREGVPLAALDKLDNPTEPKLLVTQDGFTVGGTYEPDNVQANFLEVNMDIANLECKDARQYKCDLSYVPVGGGSTKTVSANATFSVYVEPHIESIDGTRNGFNLMPLEGSLLDEKAEFEIGDVLKLSCAAQIGSKPDTKIQWRRTSETGITDKFNQYNPAEGSYTEGDALNDNHCGYDRTASITYNTSASDANRENNLIFKCYVTVSGAPYTNTYTDQKHFYMHVRARVIDYTTPSGGGGDGDYTTTSGGAEVRNYTTANGGNEDNKVTKRDLVAGAVGGVIVAVVILGVFIIFVIVRRKCKTTETQRTRLQTDISYVANSQRQLRTQTDIGLEVQASTPNTYEQLQNTVELDNKNVYDALGADSEGSSGSKAQYERLQQSGGVPSTYTALTTETLNKDGDRTYTNLQVENSADTGK